jgi:hypothetical protein
LSLLFLPPTNLYGNGNRLGNFGRYWKIYEELKYPAVLCSVFSAGVFPPAYKLEGNRQWALW